MDENVLSAIVRDKEPESLDGVEPLKKNTAIVWLEMSVRLCVCACVRVIEPKRLVVVRRD